MFYIVPLGNIGLHYEKTRHNIAWLVMDECVRAWGLPKLIEKSSYSGRFTDGRVLGSDVLVLYPSTYMNHSGKSVRRTVSISQLTHLIVVYDDVDLPFGSIKVSQSKGSGGHNGVTSVITEMGSKDFLRIRIGIAPVHNETGESVRPTGDRLANYVLGTLSPRELEQLPDIAARVRQIIELIMSYGGGVAMNKFN